jgi:hypothetical protein
VSSVVLAVEQQLALRTAADSTSAHSVHMRACDFFGRPGKRLLASASAVRSKKRDEITTLLSYNIEDDDVLVSARARVSFEAR